MSIVTQSKADKRRILSARCDQSFPNSIQCISEAEVNDLELLRSQ